MPSFICAHGSRSTCDLTIRITQTTTDTGHRGNNQNYAAAMATDANDETYFATDDNVTTAVIEVELAKVQQPAGFIIQEYIPLGQRVDGYTIECRGACRVARKQCSRKLCPQQCAP